MKALQRITVVLFILVLAVYIGTQYYYSNFVDRTSPRLTCDSETLELSIKDPESALLTGITASDDVDGDITDRVEIQGVSQLINSDTAKVSYVVFDSSNNMATCTRYVRYTDYQKPRITQAKPLVYKLGELISLKDLTESLTATCVLDGDISGNIRVSAWNISFATEGTYDITIQVTNSMGDTQALKTKAVIDNGSAENQLIWLKEYAVYVKQGASFDPDDYLRTVRDPDGTPGSRDQVKIESNVDTSMSGSYLVSYTYGPSEDSYTAYLAVVVE